MRGPTQATVHVVLSHVVRKAGAKLLVRAEYEDVLRRTKLKPSKSPQPPKKKKMNQVKNIPPVDMSLFGFGIAMF